MTNDTEMHMGNDNSDTKYLSLVNFVSLETNSFPRSW